MVEDLVTLGSSIPLLGVGGAAVNGPPPAGGSAPSFLFQGGSYADLTVPSTGQVSFAMPQAFPNGVLSAWANPEAGTYTSIQIRPTVSTTAELGLAFVPQEAGTGNFQWGAIGW